MEDNRNLNKAYVQFGNTDYADTIPIAPSSACLAPSSAGLVPSSAGIAPALDSPASTRESASAHLAPSPGPVYLEGRLVLSLSFQHEETEAAATGNELCCQEPAKGELIVHNTVSLPEERELIVHDKAILDPPRRNPVRCESINLSPIENDEVVLESYRLWDETIDNWYEDDLVVLRFEHADVVMRLDPIPTAIWAGELDTRARVIPVPDLDLAGLHAKETCDLCWKRT